MNKQLAFVVAGKENVEFAFQIASAVIKGNAQVAKEMSGLQTVRRPRSIDTQYPERNIRVEWLNEEKYRFVLYMDKGFFNDCVPKEWWEK